MPRAVESIFGLPSINPVLLAGGSGMRLWPLSRKAYPKQFVRITGDASLFQECARRFSGAGFDAPTIVTAADFRFIVSEQLAAIDIAPADVLIEPSAKNTAAAICAAALVLDARSPGALMLVAPSDHVIPDAGRFRASVMAATVAALSGKLVTFGIRPTRPETGYGWLELSTGTADFAPVPQPLRSFVEKPGLVEAETLLAGGAHLWNAGIFLFSTTAVLDAFAAHAPDVLSTTLAAVDAAERKHSFIQLEPTAWAQLRDVSIDFAVMESASNLMVVPYAGAWSDLGDWQAVWRESGPDATGTVTLGEATALECRDTLLHAASEAQQLVGIGLESIVAIAMPDAVLVAHKDHVQDVKRAVGVLKTRAVPQAESLPRDYRPWGWYESLILGPRFQVKRIVVNPGAALSMQTHQHRAGHWVVVEGTAKVTVDSDVRLAAESQSVYIAPGAILRLENPGLMPLTVIEVQTATNLREDDIVHYEDLSARERGAAG